MERVYALFAANLDELGKLKDEYACKAVYLGDPDYEIQDTEVGYKTINSIVSAVISLEQEHRDHSRSLARGIRYGSRMAPIGDDNYLQLRAAARLRLSATPASLPAAIGPTVQLEDNKSAAS
ncbi:ras GTPase-activating protein 3-like [Pollicipes pollicipes]|uniref:ras GTPase-activating protein 3-like n=1 Tax=Pollicipes pollicipes TaxID=41117 RepID=UPI00188584DE|nr:ras GTPase-activating protein 3-like [Pollicipes pollicipes]